MDRLRGLGCVDGLAGGHIVEVHGRKTMFLDYRVVVKHSRRELKRAMQLCTVVVSM